MSDKYPFTLIKEEIARREGKALDFAVGTSPFPLSPAMSEWLKQHSELALVPGNRDDIGHFCTAAALYLRDQYDVDMSAEQILPTAGGRAAMAILAACTLSPSSTVIVTEPGYPAFARLAAQLGAKVVVSHLDPTNDFAPDFEYTDDVPSGSVAMLAVNYPNNPTGATYPVDKLKEIAEIARRYRVVMLSDEIYGEIHHEGTHRSIAEFYPEGTIISSGLSKWCGAGGWRLGTFTFPENLSWLREGMTVAASETYTATAAPIQ